MKKFIRNIFAAAAVLALGPGTTRAQGILYGVGLAPNTAAPTTLTFNLTTGVATAVGALGDNSALPYGLASRKGVLYTFDANSKRIRKINPVTGAFIGTPLDIGVGNVSGEGDLTFSLNGKTGYLTTAFRPGQPLTGISPGIYTFTLGGTSTFVATTADSVGPITVDGMAFNPINGLLYALTDADTRLYTLNPATGFLTPVGELGVTPNGGYGALAFNSSGSLFATINNALYSINTTTGAATTLGTGTGTDFGNVSGAAFIVPKKARADFNGDGKSDILFQNNAGQIFSWYMDGKGRTVGSAYIYTGALGDWRVVGTADLNGDGTPDLLFQNTVGQILAWFLDGRGTPVSSAWIYVSGLGDWKIVGTPDVNGDGDSDIVFQNNLGQIFAWFMNGNGTPIGSNWIYTGGLGDWKVAGTADLNGDGSADLVLQNRAGQLLAWFLDETGAPVSSASIYNGTLGDWKVAATLDLDGDGVADLLLQNSLGQLLAWSMDGRGTPTASAWIYSSGLGDWRAR